MWRLLLLLINLGVIYAKMHSLEYGYSATTEIRNIPYVVISGMVDGQQFVYYDSKNPQAVPKQDWVNKAADPQYWERNTGNFLNFEQTSKVNQETLKQRFNYTGGLHTVQRMYGCEWNDETGETNGFNAYGYDGEDFLSLDLKAMRFISPVQQGVPTVQKWNNDKGFIEGRRQYLGTECIEWLKKYVQFAGNSLKKTVSPQVSLLQKDSSSPVSCHATGFYPSGVKISWLKNEQDHYEDVDIGELVPNEDGTFQKTSTLKTHPDEWKQNQYSCVVEHQGKTINTILTEKDVKSNNGGFPIGIIVGIVVAGLALLVVIAVIGYIVYQKKGKPGPGFVQANTSDGGSNNSSQGAQA